MRKLAAISVAAALSAGLAQAASTDAAMGSLAATVASTCNSTTALSAPGMFCADDGYGTAALTYEIDGERVGLAFTQTISTAARAADQTLLATNAINEILTLDIALDASGSLPVLAGAHSDIVALAVTAGLQGLFTTATQWCILGG